MLGQLNRMAGRIVESVLGARMYNSSASMPSTAPWADYWYMPFSLPNAGGVIGGDESYQYLSACFAATRLWCNIGSTMPLNRKRTTLNESGEEFSQIMWDDPVQRLLNASANDDQVAMIFRAMMINWQINYGTAFAEIQRDMRGNPLKLWPIHPNRCKPFRSANNGELWWHVHNNNQTESDIPDRDMLRIPYVILDHTGLLGVGVSKRSGGTVQIGQNLDRTEGDASMSGVPRIAVESEKPMAMPEQDNFRRMWREIYTQGGEMVALLVNGMKAKPLSFSAVEADFVNRRDRMIQEVARWYDTPLSLLRMAMKEAGGNTEQLGQEFQTYSLKPLEVWEQESNKKLLTDEDRADRQRFELDYKSLMRADHAGRAAYLNSRFTTGSITSNQIRMSEGDNPYGPEGDKYYVQGAMRPVDEPYNAQEPQIAPVDPKEGKANPLRDKKQKALKQKAVIRSLLCERFEKLVYKESNAAIKASAKPKEWLTWVDSFYLHHQQVILSETAGTFQAASTLGLKLDPKQIAANMVDDSRKVLIDASDGPADQFAERVKAIAEAWERDRANEFVSTITELN